MNAKEIEKMVTAKVETIIGQFRKITPVVLKIVQETQKNFQKINMNAVTNKIGKAVQFIKNKIKDLKNSSKTNEIEIKINNENVKKQITQIEKEIDSLQKKISSRHIKLSFTSSKLNEVNEQTTRGFMQKETSVGESGGKSSLSRSSFEKEDYSSLSLQKDEFTLDIMVESEELDIAKSKITELQEETSKSTEMQNIFSGFFNSAKGKIDQAKESFGNIKEIDNQVSKVAQKIKEPIKVIGSGLAKGLGHIAKYAASMFDLQKVYSTLKDSVNSWLSSQNSDAQQLSANIEYMKYSMGGVFAPVIEYVVGLVYQLMKAIQSVVYAFSGINIFAKSTASSMNKTANSASKVNKSLGGIHSDINNVSEGDSGAGSATIAPNMDLSQMDNAYSNIINMIKNGDWSLIGNMIGDKLNNAMTNIPWDKIQNVAKNIATDIAKFLNSFIATTDWNKVGNTFAQGINTIIYFGHDFIMTFDWVKLGKSIGDSINGLFLNIDWAIAGQTLGEGVKGVLDTISTTISEIDWWQIGEDIWTFLANIDWNEIVRKLAETIGKALGALSELLAGFFIDAINGMWNFFDGEIEECGGNVVLGILKGIVDAINGIGEWLYENLVKPLVEGFCELLGIHSPSTVFEEFGKNIIEGLFNGIQSLVNNIAEIWEKIKENALNVFNSIKEKVVNIFYEMKNKISDIWNGIWNNIKTVINWILTGIENMGNGVVDGVNAVIRALNRIRFKMPDWLGGAEFGFNIQTLNKISLPRLAKGNVAYSETMAIFGEYSGASTNPEITTPQNIMRETFEDVLSNRELNNRNNYNGELKQLVIQFGSTKVALEIERLLQQARRQNGIVSVTV